ncbi:hypothetical protein HK103_003004 [Boothiomyces macroporosus]|uniref:AB hydrolase-1 domain-containing protein n=1 Tax=Boothiomyces macroporosus TaxID=261099 RepID=A0AAD5UIH6_9FUNG|nr:hypothetical protein HK103_003004 [Boothiomyces macroporosus]
MSIQPLDFEKGCGFFTTKPAKVGHFIINDYALNYEIHGTGKTKVLCVMGLMSSMAGWKEVLNYFLKGYDFKKESSDYQFLVFDNRGVGHSTNGSFGRYTTSGMAKDAAELLRHVGWTDDRSVHLCGISMGGMISLELASLIPKRFKSLNLLVTCASHRPTPGYFLHSELSLLKPTKNMDDKINVLMSLLFSDEDWLNANDARYPEYKTNRERVFATLKYRMQRTRAPGIYTFLGQGLAVKTHYVSKERLNAIGKEIPDCVAIAGTKDVMIDPACTKELGDHLNCKTVFLEDKGHVIISEADLETCKELEENFTNAEKRWAKL